MRQLPLTSPAYGENVTSWQTIWDQLYPEDAADPHDDASAEDMNRHRGLIMAQGTQVETCLRILVKQLAPHPDVEGRTAGRLARDVRKLLSARHASLCNDELSVIDKAISRRNHAVHTPVIIGSSWHDYATDGGEWVPVISLMNGTACGEADLLCDLALQQRATVAAVRLLHAGFAANVSPGASATVV